MHMQVHRNGTKLMLRLRSHSLSTDGAQWGAYKKIKTHAESKIQRRDHSLRFALGSENQIKDYKVQRVEHIEEPLVKRMPAARFSVV